MVAIYSDSKTGYHWLYSNKYACQYVDIPYRYNPWDYSVVFPCDLNNIGKIEIYNSSKDQKYMRLSNKLLARQI